MNTELHAVTDRDRLGEQGSKSCITGRKSRKTPVSCDKRKYRRRNRNEIMFGRPKDWRRVTTANRCCGI
ncbi:hypothetical protein JCM15831A_16460 [Asaia astilbis]